MPETRFRVAIDGRVPRRLFQPLSLHRLIRRDAGPSIRIDINDVKHGRDPIDVFRQPVGVVVIGVAPGGFLERDEERGVEVDEKGKSEDDEGVGDVL